MSSLAEQYHRIERYLQGAMTPGELDEFNQKMASDADLAAAVSLHRELSETLAGEGIHKFRRTLKRVDAEWRSSGGGLLRFLMSPRTLGIAASLLLLIGLLFWLNVDGPNHMALSHANFEQLPLQTQMGSYENNIPQVQNRANTAYIAKDYAAASEAFLELSELDPFNPDHQLFAGICQLGNQQAEASVATLQPLADGTDQSVVGEASWYLALAFLQLDDAASAKSYLTKLVETKAYNWDKAAALLEQL